MYDFAPLLIQYTGYGFLASQLPIHLICGNGLVPLNFVFLWQLSLKFVCRGRQRYGSGKVLLPGSGSLAQQAPAGHDASPAPGSAPHTASPVPSWYRALWPAALLGQQLLFKPSEAVIRKSASSETSLCTTPSDTPRQISGSCQRADF